MAGVRHLVCPRLGGETQQFSLVLLNTAFIEPVYALLRPYSRYSLAADGAANRLYTLIKANPSIASPTHIVGDLDSVRKETVEFFGQTEVREIPSQDWNDLQKCLEVMKGLGCVGRVYVVASMYGRVDHTLANISSLFDPQYQSLDLVMLDQANFSIPIFPGTTHIHLPADPYWTKCGLIPMERSTVTLTGLKWCMNQEVMEVGGLVSSSNEPVARVVTVNTTGKLLWTASTEVE